jgi:D-3-phosphoglycerate dehydrogenase
MKVLLTSLGIPLLPTDAEHFVGLDVQLEQVDGRETALLIEAARDADALLVVHENIDATVISKLGRCKIIVRCGIGYDNIDTQAAANAGIWVANIPDANFREVATHAVAMILALTRHLPAYDRAMHSVGWAGMELGAGLHRAEAQTLGLLGMGRIGSLVAAMGQAIGFKVQAYDPYLPPSQAEGMGVTLGTLDEILAGSDIISLHLPMTAETKGIIGSGALAKMKPGSYLVNVSRGGLVDEVALAAALESGHLSGAGIDVWEVEPPEADNPLLACKSALMSPHAAYLSFESFGEIRIKSFQEAARVLGGEPPLHPVNEPFPN